MSTSGNDDRRRNARALFEAQVDAVDGATATALRARRRDALATMRTPRRAPWWWPASGVASAALALGLWWPHGDGPGTEGVDAFDGDRDSPVAAARFADAALAEFDNDVEFYAWLATAPDDLGLDDPPTALPAQGPQKGMTP